MRNRPTAIAALLGGALLLSACAGNGEGGVDPAAEATTPPEPDCAETRLDLAETSFGRYTPTHVLPVQGGGAGVHFQIVDNQFDPCLPLSWITVSGTAVEGQRMPTPDTHDRQAVIFFHYADTVTDPAPPLVSEITRVVRHDAERVEVGYTTTGGDALALTHVWDGDRVAAEGAGEPDPAEGATLLDLETRPLGHDAPPTLFGNARDSRVTEQYELWGRTEPMLLTVPLNGATLTCDITLPTVLAQHQISCRGDGVAWPEIPPGLSEETSWRGPGEAVGLGISFMPAIVNTTMYAPTMPAPHITVAEDGITRVGSYLVDTTGEDVVFVSGMSAVTVGVEEISVGQVSYVDTTRW